MEIDETLTTNLQLTQLLEVKDKRIKRITKDYSNTLADIYKLRKKVMDEMNTSYHKQKQKDWNKTYYDAMVFMDDELAKIEK